MSFLDIIPSLTWRDLIDVLFLSLVAYQLFVWFKGTKAFRVLIGLVVLAGIYSLARFWGLFMTTWVFQVLWQVLVILLLILFQAEIRQVLEKVSLLRYLRARRYFSKAAIVEEISRVAFDLARDNTGAILVMTREDDPAEFISGGQPVMALPTAAIIKSIFNPQSPAHDGAVVVSGERVTEMGAFLPLTKREDLPAEYGTRHRAAVGLCERTDSICLVISEERGKVSTVVRGEVRAWDSSEGLASQLKDWLGVTESPGPTLKSFVKAVFIENWGAKIGALLLVTLAWLLMAGAQEMKTTMKVPVDFINVEGGLVVMDDTSRWVSLDVSGRRRQIVNLGPGVVKVRVDLAGLPAGSHLVRLWAKDVTMPLGLTIGGAWPQNIRVTLGPAKTPSPEGRKDRSDLEAIRRQHVP